MLSGCWKEDARQALDNQFHPEVREHLPEPSTAYNLFASLVDQTSSLYDGEDVTLQIVGRKPSARSLATFDLDTWYAIAADNLRFVRGLNECYIRRGWNESEGVVTYTIVTPDCVVPHVDPGDPSQPNRVRHLVEKYIPGLDESRWCWADWNLSDPEQPSYRILMQGKQGEKVDGDGLDVTLQVAPELAGLPGNWPYWTGTTEEPGKPGEGDPIWPWTLYHSKVTNWSGGRLHKPYPGQEAVDATLEASTEWTWWRGGLLNAAHALRAIINGKLKGTSTGGRTDFVPANPMFVAQIEGDKAGVAASIGQWSSAFDAEATAKAIQSKAVMAALSLGLAPGDVQVGPSSGPARTSSIAIQVTRQGRRSIEGKMIRPMRMGDQHNFAGAAQLANAYGGARLPTDKRVYRPVYSHTELTPSEIAVLVDSLIKRVESGLMHPATALQVLEPWLTEEEAAERILEIQAFRRVLAQVQSGAVPTEEPETPEEEPEAPEESDDETEEGEQT